MASEQILTDLSYRDSLVRSVIFDSFWEGMSELT